VNKTITEVQTADSIDDDKNLKKVKDIFAINFPEGKKQLEEFKKVVSVVTGEVK